MIAHLDPPEVGVPFKKGNKMTKNLTEKEIKTVNTKVLNSRFCRLVLKGETLPANEITVADAREILLIEDELHERTIKAVGHDFYPPGH